MGAPPSSHPTDQTLESYGLGKLDGLLADAVDKHLAACPVCRRRVAVVSPDSFLSRIRGVLDRPGGSGLENADAGLAVDVRVGESSDSAAGVPAWEALPPGLAGHPDYELVKELGRGGMGVVYLARNRLMEREEVLKVMSRHVIEKPGVLDRFLREIRAVARLRHPSIVTAYTAFRLGESIVFAMEYVDGSDLARLVKAKGPLPVAHAAYFAHQAALGLQHAFEMGMVHRDIKPSNLMLSRPRGRAQVKILDFGLAKATREEALDGALTHHGQLLGTPDYIAPEQTVDAASADIRADIYSLGCTLYTLLSGRPPFQAKGLYDLLQAHHSINARPLNLVRADVPLELGALVGKMMAKEPERRFQTPAAVAEALRPFFKKPAVASAALAPHAASWTPARSGPSSDSLIVPDWTETSPGASLSDTPASDQHTLQFWSSLPIDSAPPPAPAQERPRTVPAPNRPPPWRSRPLATAVAASVFGLVALGLLITIRNRNGDVLTVKTDGRQPFRVESNAGRVDYKPLDAGRPKGPAGAPASEKAGSPSPAAPAATNSRGESASDRLQAGTVWTGERSYRRGGYAGKTVTYELHVRERDGRTFRGHKFDNGPGRNRVDIVGQVDGAAIRWTEENAVAVMTMHGTINGDLIEITLNGVYSNGATNVGDGRLTLSSRLPGKPAEVSPGGPK